MPSRIPVIYPRYRQIYRPGSRAAIAAQPRAGAGRNAVQQGGVDQSSTGNVGGDIVKAINNQMQVNRQNQVANQLLNTETPPRAQWVGGNAPAPGVNTLGSTPQTGGSIELQARQQAAQQDAQQQQQALQDALTRSKIAANLALTTRRAGTGTGTGTTGGNADRWKQYAASQQPGGKAGKPPPYEVGSDANTNLDADKPANLAADFDGTFGKGAYAKVAPNFANATKDDKGNFVISDAKGNPITTLPPDQANYWLSRYNAMLVRSGQQPIPNPGITTANPNSTQPAGSQANPFVPKSQIEARSIPYNSFMKDPTTGQIGQKLPPQAPQANQPAQPNQPQGNQQPATSSAVDFSGGNNQQVASNQPSSLPPTPNIPTLVPPVGQPSMQRPDLSTGVGLDQSATAAAAPQDQGSQQLADAIAKARLVAGFQGMA